MHDAIQLDVRSAGEYVAALIVVGPTASGKADLAIALAEQFQGEVVNFDSVQLYRDFDLGTAKPSARDLARVPHHLIGVADAHEPWTAGEYARRARPVVEDIAHRGRVPVLVGGTGFYLRALVQGLSDAPVATAPLRARLRRRPAAHLYRLLRRLDPEAAERIAERDTSKVIRALEVRCLTGRPMAAGWRASPPAGWPEIRPLKLGLNPDRAALYRRIDERARMMFSGGIQEETRRLLPLYPVELRIWIAHGYKQACDIVLRHADPAGALAEAQQEQRRYAKRQWTWFRADPSCHWLAGFGDEPGVQRQAAALAAAHLASFS